jgi:3-deoxy-7-phosphoheptulonate synthase
LGVHGLELLAEARRVTGLPVVTEVLDVRDVDLVCRHADVLQIGSRNMHNAPLLKEVGSLDKPVLLKRGFAATIEEWFLAAEYILAQGNDRVILCERGIRTFETATRNTLDLSAVVLAHLGTHLPVIVDPSHAAGRSDLVAPLAKAALAVGADGLLIEVHPDPASALRDGDQALTAEEFASLLSELGLGQSAQAQAGGSLAR